MRMHTRKQTQVLHFWQAPQTPRQKQTKKAKHKTIQNNKKTKNKREKQTMHAHLHAHAYRQACRQAGRNKKHTAKK